MIFVNTDQSLRQTRTFIGMQSSGDDLDFSLLDNFTVALPMKRIPIPQPHLRGPEHLAVVELK